MILVLAVRFRKFIALFLYGVFYSQLILAAESFRIYHPEAAGYRRATNDSFRFHAPVHPPTFLPVMADSNVVPSHTADPIRNLSSSPSFRPGRAPLGNIASQSQNLIGGPNQPEMQSFQSVNSNNMVDFL